MNHINRIIMHGNLTKDPEIKEFSNSKLAKFGLATNRKFKDRDEVCFVDVLVWGKLVDTAEKYLKKGSAIIIEGRLKLESWESNGKKNSKHVIICESFTMTGRSFDKAQAQVDVKNSILTSNEIKDGNTLDDLPF